MKVSLTNVAALLMVLAVCGASTAQSAPRAEDAQGVERLVATLSQEASTLCPLSDPGDQDALDRCRSALFNDSYFKRSLGRIVLWGRPSPAPGTRLKDTTLTQFGREVLSGLYLPLFMFNGRYRVEYDASEARYRARVEAVFRNNLVPGQYPYPFWHDAKKWNDYQRANGLTLWIDPYTSKIVVAQFSRQEGADPRLDTASRIPPAFDGNWMWVDRNGEQQPKPTLFVGLFRTDNPHLEQLQTTYKDLALAMRKGTCNTCHVPDNPEKMKRLVLLQTPAHAAAEIKRVMAAVRNNRMPLDEIGIEKELDAETRALLLKFGAAFESTVSAAYAWERSDKADSPQTGAGALE
jgi:hypothetical protein